jgi:hypothetical protein
MAFLRFHRDRRGYEHFYLVEPTTTRRGKTRARVLYWFRSPPNVRVGREPFDEDVRRTLEAQNPGVEFDWRKISETPIPSADAERWRERRRQERAARAAQRAAGAEPELGESEDEDIELPENAAPDLAVDAAEQQADALALTEESLVSIAATVDPPAPEPVQTREPVQPRPDRHRRRRRRRRPQSTESHRTNASAEPSRVGPVEAGQPREPGEPREAGEPRGPDEPHEPHERHEPGEPHDV